MGADKEDPLGTRVRYLANSIRPSREGDEGGDVILELLTLAQQQAQDAARDAVETNQPSDAAEAIHILRSLEQTWQEHRTFSVRHRHDKRLFGLKLLMARSAYVVLIGTAITAFYVVFDHGGFPATVVAEASTTLLVQTAGLMAWCWRLVVAREAPQPAPVTVADMAGSGGFDTSAD